MLVKTGKPARLERLARVEWVGMGGKSGCWEMILWTTDIKVGEKEVHVYGHHFARPVPDQVGTVQA